MHHQTACTPAHIEESDEKYLPDRFLTGSSGVSSGPRKVPRPGGDLRIFSPSPRARASRPSSMRPRSTTCSRASGAAAGFTPRATRAPACAPSRVRSRPCSPATCRAPATPGGHLALRENTARAPPSQVHALPPPAGLAADISTAVGGIRADPVAGVRRCVAGRGSAAGGGADRTGSRLSPAQVGRAHGTGDGRRGGRRTRQQPQPRPRRGAVETPAPGGEQPADAGVSASRGRWQRPALLQARGQSAQGSRAPRGLVGRGAGRVCVACVRVSSVCCACVALAGMGRIEARIDVPRRSAHRPHRRAFANR